MKKSVLLALPRLGQPEFESTLSAFVHASNEEVTVTVDPRCCSLLAFGFNQSWCNFANGDYDYFAMLHADLAPQGPWLDILVSELEAHGLNVLHAVVAIKDERGLTSTAVGSRWHQFEAVRRITVKELQQLPETFDCAAAMRGMGMTPSGQLRECLLPNTGCMIVKRADFPMGRFPGFTINDRVAVTPDNKWIAQVAPEDWNFGRWCAREGLRVGGTRKIVTHHFGRALFTTGTPWGQWAQDQNYLDATNSTALHSMQRGAETAEQSPL